MSQQRILNETDTSKMKAGREFKANNGSGSLMGYAGKKVIYIIIDGLGDIPQKVYSQTRPLTPLMAARKPTIDLLAKNGINGLFYPIGVGVTPGSDTAHLSIFGYDPRIFYHGRGPLEALGANMTMMPGDVAFRCNFATVEKNIVIDRRANRLKYATLEEVNELTKAANEIHIGCSYEFRHTVEHRGVLVLKDEKRGLLSGKVSDTDPHTDKKSGATDDEAKIKDSAPTVRSDSDDFSRATYSSQIVCSFTKRVIPLLEKCGLNVAPKNTEAEKANSVLVRGAGIYVPVESISVKYGVKCALIAGGALYKGIARYVGMTVPDGIEGVTGTSDTNLIEKAKKALEMLEDHDTVFIHVKATDNFGHDGDFEGKKKMIENIEEMVKYLIPKSQGAYFVITGDHTTSVTNKGHSSEPVPVLISGPGLRVDGVESFDELSAMNGGLGHLKGPELFRIITDLLGKGEHFGA